MSNKPLIHLFIPQLFQPLSVWKQGFQFEPNCTYLIKILQNFQKVRTSEVIGISASLFSSLGLAEGCELPAAYYRFKSQQFDHSHLINHSLLCADPVHLEIGMSDITLTDKSIDLSANEASELMTLLNEYFNQDGLNFMLDSNKKGYLSFAGNEEVDSSPLENVFRKNITNFLIKSKGRNWQALQNEVQMLLHSAPLNQQREMAGLPTVNSLWLWGGGDPEVFSQKASHVFSDNKSRGEMIAQASECKYQPLSHLTDVSDTEFVEGKTIIISEVLDSLALNNDIEHYQKELNRLDNDLFKPLLQLWQWDKIDILIDSCDGKTIKPLPSSAWKFWKKSPASLTDLGL
ncbi:MAG TPA: hypothetical protein EYG71_06130 [Leucothrix sp.]|nr:hypothetical protein [Leucothrix sp.]